MLKNNWVGYLQRSYQQIKTQVLTALQGAVPEITDHTESNLFVKMIDIHAGLTEQLNYYIDNAARESFISSLRLYSSAIKLARQLDYRPHSYLAAQVDLVFTLSGPAPSLITIPINTQVTDSSNSAIFYTTIVATIPAGQTTVTVPAIQAQTVSNITLGTSNGQANQIFSSLDTIRDGSMVVRVNSIAWASKTTFGFSLPADQVFVQTVNEQGQVIVRFGSGINGLIPPTGNLIQADYQRTAGAIGNLAENTLKTIVSAITVPGGFTLTVNNPQRAAGGSDVESLESLKRKIPLAQRTLERAVTRQDYVDVVELCPGVALGGVLFNCGKDVELYIVPDGGGIANSTLLSTAQSWMELRKMLTTNVVVKAAGEVRMLFNINVTVLPQYSNTAVALDVANRITSFLSFQNQKIYGSVQISDIYEVVETTTGVNFSSIIGMNPVPYARPLFATTTVLLWNRTIQTTSNVVAQWRIIFTSSTVFQLLKNENFVGNFTVGVAVTTPEIVFTILTSTYALNDQYEFWTYPFFGSIQLQEPSLVVSLLSDITINPTGGV